MVLRSLEMQGFKSFPDRTELNFGKGITAVVGPNGSGKSNISDAVRWVLGETSTKSLRGSKMEDVIFGGTSSRKPLGFAQVVLTLDNTDQTLKDKGDIVSVCRRYYRSGESEYKIDGEVVRRKDIHELFMDTGLGADGYSMVGQGKIDSIISAKNEDRRELFEEAAGISRFRHKRTDAERRLEQAQENLVRLLDILNELESRVGPLKTQSEKAQKFLVLADEKKELEIGVWLNKINKFTGELREQERKIDATDESYKIAEKDIEEIEKEIESIAEKTASINTEIEQIRTGASAFEEEALRKDGEISVLETNIKHNNETIERLKNDIGATDDANVSIENQIKEKEKLVLDGEKIVAEKREELRKITEKMEQIQSDNEKFSRKSVELNQQITMLTMKLSDCRVKCSKALSSIDEIKSRQGMVDDAIANCEKEYEIIKSQKAESEENLKFINERIEESQNFLNGFELKLKSKTEKADKLKTETEKASIVLQQKESRIKMLQDLERNMDGYSGAVKAVMRQSKSNALGGICGVLSQLINVESEYSTAVEVALGGAMQNIVTENEADAKRAIYYLKQNKVGRATFLPVSAIKGRTLDERGLDDNLGYVAIATELVGCDAKYKNIIANLLGRTVVVEDMDSAIGISKRYGSRFKIVTLDGQVVNPGGSMTGGSRVNNAGILSRSNQIDELTKECQKLAKNLEESKSSFKLALEDANKAAADFSGAQADLRNANEELIRAEGDDKLLKDKLDSAQNQLQNLKEEKTSSSDRIKLLSAENETSQKEVEQVNAQIDEAEKALASISGNAEEILKQREEFRTKSEELNLQMVTAIKDSESAKISIEELKNRISSQSNRVSSIKDEIAQIESNNVSLNSQIAEVKSSADELRNKAKGSEDSVKNQIEERSNLEKRSVELRQIERAKNADREKLSSELVRLEERKNTMRREYDDINTKLYDEYELTRHEAEEVAIDIEDIAVANKRLHELRASIKGLGSVNVAAIEEYKEVAERYEFLKEQIDDIEKSKNELMKIIEDLTSSMSEKFLTQFNKINEQFKISFADFFGGGKGELILEEPQNCLESPIEIKIQPPGKSVQNINLFSGGEKSLAAMALLFSVLKVTPSPFCIYDEVEAALDDVNVERFAKYMRKMTDKTQFISITHRRGTMEEADVLYGVTMQEKGVSKLLELQTAELAAKMGLED